MDGRAEGLSQRPSLAAYLGEAANNYCQLLVRRRASL